MGSVLVIRNPSGRQFTDITSVALVGGVAFGECFLQLSPLLFDNSTIEAARGFGAHYVGASHQTIFDQYCRLSSDFRLEVEGYAPAITKSVRGISIGISTGGSLDALSSALARPARHALVFIQREFLVRFSRFVRGRLMALSEDALDRVTSGFSTGTSGGFFSMYDGGALHGANGNSTLDLDLERIRTMNFAVIQMGGGAIVGAGINLLIIGDFPSLRTMVPVSRDAIVSLDAVFTTSIDDSLFFYIGNVLAHAYCYAFIGDAAIGAILPGIDLNLIAS